MLRTALTDRFALRAPIVGAPMAGASGGGLAAAVSAGGGLGMIGVGSSTAPDWIAAAADEARSQTARFGIGLMAWNLTRRPEQLDAVIAAAPILVSVSFGDYRPALGPLRRAGIPVGTQVGDVASARQALEDGVEVIVARGGEGGGHGDDRVATLPLLQGVLDAVGEADAIVLAAGGVATARGLAAVLAAGAAGAWVGTAFLACTEALTAPGARRRLLAATELDTVSTSVFDIAQSIPWPPAYRGRALANAFTARWHGREQELAERAEARRELDAPRQGGDDPAFVYAGQAVGSLSRERSAREVIEDLAGGAETLLRRW